MSQAASLPSSRPGLSQTGKILLILAGAAAVVFWLGAALPYITTDRAAFGPFPDLFWDRRYALWLHILGGTIAMFLGPVQIWLGETRHRLPLHRTLGTAYLAGAAITCGAAFYLSFTTPVGLPYAAGLAGMALAGTLTTTMAVVAIKRRHFDQHREWMIRSYVVILAFVFFRAMAVSMEALAIGGSGRAGETGRATFAAWASWALPLLFTECALQWRKVTAAGRR